MEEILSVFIQEAREQIAAMEAELLGMEQADGDPEAEVLNAIFRAAHTIKGGAGVVELGMIERFTHVLENALDKLRNHEIPVSDTLISILLNCCDHIGALLDRVATGAVDEDENLKLDGEAIAEKLRACIGSSAVNIKEGHTLATSARAASPREHTSEVESEGSGKAINDCWHISVRFGENVLRNGMDPAAILRYLLTLGEIAHIATLADGMPAASQMNPESCYLGCEISFRSQADKSAIERAFDFVRDDCALRILPPDSKVADYLQLIGELPEEPMRLGEILVKSGALTQDELIEGLSRQQAGDAATTPPPPLGNILVEQKVIQPEIVEAAVARQKQVSDKKAEEARLIRVHAGKLDHLIDLVGELVIAGASASLLAQNSKLGHLVEATSLLTRLVENIRDSALQLRMVQIGETFNRFHRVVRDTARELGKEIELVIRGGETELDKSVVEKIGDPLMHLVRNAMDHGLETPQIRIAQGKPATGRVELNAYHDSGNIVIEITDDGAGLSREKIRAKAIERGLIGASQVLGDEEIHNLIFEAGFSTAEKVTNLSGRGVGMDVVKRNIQALRGSVEVASNEGAGSRFTIRLPLTLAIIDGFLVEVGKSSFVVPLDMVLECLELSEADRQASDTRSYLNLRGEALPFIRLRELLAIEGQPPRRESVVVVHFGNQKAGLVVDRLLGEFQTVIKPLGQLFRHLRGISGSTILGSGDVALILDVPVLVQQAASRENEQTASAMHSTRPGMAATEIL
ncbi:Chemotaxis protein histidine kinase-like protein [Sterolibacterium denitrificans]|uniref:Chemotaxis protein histidine kinase-like protein n=2 Tax=Sterolibacterium denitrificans TaxID=157592 RepID=A0A7Z7HT51_9PROT|nr:chemotaxis protein CheA [Sterolibacterium denitrificans]KYC29169.1 chemotaxis protein CheA [Sterolibacterium denitrificans]SMB29406.1 Chemotaxis protein histidine kinase-like protein [Sterolibacterium denitrificans]